MKLCQVHYAQVRERHPQAPQEALAALRRGRSKERDTKPYEWEWSYETVVMVDGRVPRKETLEEGIKEELGNTQVYLFAKKGRWHWISILKEHPPELEPSIRERLTVLYQRLQERRLRESRPQRPLPLDPRLAWRQQPQESRHVVLAELSQMLKGWEASAHDQKTRTDAETLRRLIQLGKT